MSTIATIESRLPTWMQHRYADSTYISWTNEALRALAREGFLPEVKKECGVVVEDDKWIDLPGDFRTEIELYHPLQPEIKYPIEQINGKLKLIDKTFDKEEDPDDTSSITTYGSGYIEFDDLAPDDDDYNGYLFVVTAGTLAGNGYRIADTAEDGGSGNPRITFLEADTVATWDAGSVSAGDIVQSGYYLMLKYVSPYATVAATNTEIPVGDEFEDCIESFYRWKAEAKLNELSQAAMASKGQWMEDVDDLKAERRRLRQKNVIVKRAFTGMKQKLGSRYRMTHTNASD